MTHADALALLDLPSGGASAAQVERAYEDAYNDFQLRIQNAPTPKLRARFEERLGEVEEAHATLRGASADEAGAELPGSRPVEGEPVPALVPPPIMQDAAEASRPPASPAPEAQSNETSAPGTDAPTLRPPDAPATPGADGEREAAGPPAVWVLAGVALLLMLTGAGAYLWLRGGSEAAPEVAASASAASSPDSAAAAGGSTAPASTASSEDARVTQLLTQAERYAADNSMTSPSGANALEVIEEVERLDPGNAEARALRRQMTAVYRSRAGAAASDGEHARARDQYARMERAAAPGSAAAREAARLQREMRTLQQQAASEAAAAREEEVISSLVVETKPEMIGRLQPIYPEEARRANIEGRVYLDFVIDKQGKARDIKVLRSPSKLLSDAAIQALESARFEPGRQRGQAVEVRMSLPIRFGLN